MNLRDIAVCERRIVEEELLSQTASTPDDAAAHAQLALLYRAQLRVLMRMKPDAAAPLPAARADADLELAHR